MSIQRFTVADLDEMLRAGRILMFAPVRDPFRAPGCMTVLGMHQDCLVFEGPRDIRERGRAIANAILSTLPFPGDPTGWEA